MPPVTINLGDCRDVDRGLKSIESGSVALVYADPPYGASNHHTTHWAERAYASIDADWDRGDNVPAAASWIPDAVRALRPGGAICVSCSFHNEAEVLAALSDPSLDLSFKNRIVWFRTNAIPLKRAKQAGLFGYSHEYVFYFRKNGGPGVFNYAWLKERAGGVQMRDVWVFPWRSTTDSVKGFRSTKPYELVSRLVGGLTNEGDLVIDPFVGSGTTPLVCAKTDRRFVGWETLQAHRDLAVQRLLKQGVEVDVETGSGAVYGGERLAGLGDCEGSPRVSRVRTKRYFAGVRGDRGVGSSSDPSSGLGGPIAV